MKNGTDDRAALSSAALRADEYIARIVAGLPENAVILGVPGSPVSGILAALERASRFMKPIRLDVSEEDAVRRLIGANSSGLITVAIMKHTGFFRVQELMSTMANHDLRAPMVLIVGDEPGATSQMGNDSRQLCDATRTLVVEPAFSSLESGFRFCLAASSQLRQPVVFRITEELTLSRREVAEGDSAVSSRFTMPAGPRDYFASEGLVLGRSRRAVARRGDLRRQLEGWAGLNRHVTPAAPDARFLVVAAGGLFDPVRDLCAVTGKADVLEINTPNLLPELRVLERLSRYERVLVLEDWEPYLEGILRSLLQRAGLASPRVLGRLANVGEPPYLSDEDRSGRLQRNLGAILQAFVEGSERPAEGPVELEFPFRRSTGPYLRVFQAYAEAAASLDLRPCLSVSTGNTRYAVMDTPYEPMVSFMGPMGSEVLTLAGLLDSTPVGNLAPGVILGDYTFIHSAWKDVSWLSGYRCETGRKIVTVILANGGSRTTGGQPCEDPISCGHRLIKGWERRFAAAVDVHEGERLVELLAHLLQPGAPEDIAVVEI